LGELFESAVVDIFGRFGGGLGCRCCGRGRGGEAFQHAVSFGGGFCFPAEVSGDFAAGGGSGGFLLGGAGFFDDAEEVAFEVSGWCIYADFITRDAGAEVVEDLLHGFAGEGGGGDLDGVGVGEEFAEGALGLDAATVVDYDAVADVFDIGEEVAAEDDGGSAVGEGDNEIFDFAAADGVEAGGGFIEDDEFRVIDEGLGEADTALHALGEFPDEAAVDIIEADHFEELCATAVAFGGGQVEEAAEEVDGFPGVEVAVEVGFLGEVTDSAFSGDVSGGVTEYFDMAAGGVEEPEEHFDRGRFTGAVGAEEAEDFAAADFEVDVIDGAGFRAAPEVLEDFGEAADDDDGFLAWRAGILWGG
jgi:hypothetical protein